jgi:lysophospholipase L1-like esterase
MKRLPFALLLLLCVPNVALAIPTLYVIGDSTVNNSNKGEQGWGTPFQKLFDPAKVHVVNKARGGRSSRTYYTEGLWDEVAAQLKPGDFVLMQFGHNDGGSLNDPKGRASIKGNGDETQDVTDAKTGKKETVHSYGWYLRKYCTDAKAKGATPIVLSPIPRNIWKDEHTVVRNAHDYGKWAAEAAKQAGAQFIDLNDIVARHYDQLGQEKVKSEFFTPTDHTHTTPAGAELNAQCVVEGIRGLKDSPLTGMLLPSN